MFYQKNSGIMIICHSDAGITVREALRPICHASKEGGEMPRDPSDFAQDDKLVACERCGTQVGDDGGLLAGGQIGAAGHAANEMWPLISRIFGDWWQSVAFEATGDEKSVSILQLLRINVIGARI